MLEEFLYNHNIDIALLQEVRHLNTQKNPYTAHINKGKERRGTAILVKEG